MKKLYFNLKYIITFIGNNFLINRQSDINIKSILMKLNINSFSNRTYNTFEYAISLLHVLENNSRIILIEAERYFIYSLLTNTLVGINIIKLENTIIYYKSNTITIGFYNNIKALMVIIFKSEKS